MKELGCSSCKFGLFSAALESVLKVVNSAAAAVQNISESRSALQYACREASKRERMFIIGYRKALVSLRKVFANQYSWSVVEKLTRFSSRTTFNNRKSKCSSFSIFNPGVAKARNEDNYKQICNIEQPSGFLCIQQPQ